MLSLAARAIEQLDNQVESAINDQVCSPRTPVQLDSQDSFSRHHVLQVPEQACPAEVQLEDPCFKHVHSKHSHSEHSSQRSSHSSNKHSRKHRHERSASTGGGSSCVTSVSGRSFSFSSGVSSEGSLSSITLSSSYNCCADRSKSFTVAQLHSHKHRLAACGAARSGSPPGCFHDPNCLLKRGHHHHSGSCTNSSTGAARNSSKAVHKQRVPSCTAGAAHRQGSICQLGSFRPVLAAYAGAGAGFFAADLRLNVLGSNACSLPQRGLLLAESVGVQDIGKGFRSHWYTNRVLLVYDGSRQLLERSQMLKHLPQQPGLHLWLIKPPNGRQWVAVRLDAAENLQQGLAECLHADGSCGPHGFKQRVLLDLQCRGFAVQIRHRPMKHTFSSVHDDLSDKLQRFDFALNDTDNNGCRPIELPDGRPVHSFPWVVGPMMKLYEKLFVRMQ